MTEPTITVIYDGNCRLCNASVKWLQAKLQISALAYQDTDLSPYGLTQTQCEKEVFALADGQTYSGASAVAMLLKYRGNMVAAFLIAKSGKISHLGYRWVASHRNSYAVKVLTVIIEKLNKKR